MHADLAIPLLPRAFGVADLTETMARRIEAGLRDPATRLTEIVGALINVHRADINDARDIRVKFAGMAMEVKKRFINGDYVLFLRRVPLDCLHDGKNVIWAAVEHVSAAIRDLVFAPEPGKGLPGEVEETGYLREFMECSGFLHRGDRGLVMFTWGGHRVSRREYDFAKHLAYWLALAVPDMENVTGCGDGIMKAPFKGAQGAYAKQRSFERFGRRDCVGFTEKGILAAEPPNGLVDRLVVFPTMEDRLEAFIRGAARGKVHPGGAGTLEEIMTILAVLVDPANKGLSYPLDFVEPEDGVFFQRLREFLGVCGGQDFNGLYAIHRGAPSLYAARVAEETRGRPMRTLWNAHIRFDPRLRRPMAAAFEDMEALDLTRREGSLFLLIELRRFFSALVRLSVISPEIIDGWGGELPRLRGDPEVLAALDALIQGLAAEGRIHPGPGRARPYRVD